MTLLVRQVVICDLFNRIFAWKWIKILSISFKKLLVNVKNIIENFTLLEYLYILKTNCDQYAQDEIEKRIQFRVVYSEVLCHTATIHGIVWQANPDSKLLTTIDGTNVKTIREMHEEIGIQIEHSDQPICFDCPNEKEVFI